MLIEATVFRRHGVVVSSVGSLMIVQDLQGRLVEVALYMDGRGSIDLLLASDARVGRWRAAKNEAKQAARARKSAEYQRARKAANQRAWYERRKATRQVARQGAA